MSASEHKIHTSIIIPAYNEEKMIEKVIADLKKYLQQGCEIIVVNDGSKDNTQQILERISGIRIVRHAQNRGYGAALKSGIKQAKAKHVLIIDADGTYPPESVSELIRHKDNYDMVVGARINPQSQIPLMRKPVKWLFNQLANYLTSTKIPDLNSGLRIIRKDVVNRFVHLLPNGFSFTTTITLALLTNSYTIKYLPIDYYKRTGKSKISPIKDTLNFTQLIIRTILYFNPLKVFIPISVILFALSLGVLIYSYFFTPQIMDITIVVLFISAIQILAIGMIADLIVKSRK